MASSVEFGPGISWVAPTRSTKRSSSTHARRLTSSSRIIAVWAAGPPKATSPSLRNTATTSPGSRRRSRRPLSFPRVRGRDLPVAGCQSCLEPTSPGTRRAPAPPSWTSRRTPSTWTSRPVTPHSGSTTTIEFTCSSPGATTFADLVGATVHEITLNGEQVDASAPTRTTASRSRGLAADNTLVVRADCTYSRTGEGPAPLRGPRRRPRLPLHAVRGPGRPPCLYHLRAARPQGAVHLHGDHARRRRPPTPRRPSRKTQATDRASRSGGSPRPSRCRPTSPRWSPAI